MLNNKLIDTLQPNFSELRDHYDYADAVELLSKFKSTVVNNKEDKLYSEEDLRSACIHFADLCLQSPTMVHEHDSLQTLYPKCVEGIHNWIERRRLKRDSQ